MKRLICVLLSLLGFLSAHTVYAVQEPKAGEEDSRIRVIEYNPNQVVRVNGYLGYATTIVFERGESTDHIITGFVEAWEVVPLGDNRVVVKAKKRTDADSNLTIITTRGRTYNFELGLVGGDGAAKTPNARGMMFEVRFHYPEEHKGSAVSADAGKKNYRYSAQGSDDGTPTKVWDNGTFTYLTFAAQQEIPSVFVVNSDGTESMVNKHMEGDTLVVHRVVRVLRLRRGESVVCIIREDPIPRTPSSTTGTTVNGLRREGN